jgi:ribonucleoside-triphosphate reductase
MELSNKILSDITVYMKYAKYVPELKRRETWEDIVDRNKNMHLKKYPHLKDEIENVYKFVYDKKVLPSMRSMQFAGKPIEISPNRIYNCAYTPVDDWRVFSEVMFLLLGGSGVGFSVQKHHVEQLPEIRKPNPERGRRWLIADSIEGWADAVKVLVKSYFFGGSRIIFDFSDIRPKGARLVTSGGKAPGPQPLKECLIKLEGILDAKEDGDKLTSIEVHDIICHIADAVLAGGIRRAALISLFSADDNDMIACKSGSWWELNPQRGRANNSAVLLRHKLDKEFFIDLWKKVEASGAGEPGFYLSNDKEWGTNPCITGDALVTVKDHSATENGEVMSDGVIYEIPLKQLVDLYETSEYPPMVLSMNTETGDIEWDYMDAAAMTRESADVIELELEDGSSLKLTPDHKVYTKNRGYIFAKDLTDDDILVKIG